VFELVDTGLEAAQIRSKATFDNARFPASISVVQ
jgi:hypothetical protein